MSKVSPKIYYVPPPPRRADAPLDNAKHIVEFSGLVSLNTCICGRTRVELFFGELRTITMMIVGLQLCKKVDCSSLNTSYVLVLKVGKIIFLFVIELCGVENYFLLLWYDWLSFRLWMKLITSKLWVSLSECERIMINKHWVKRWKMYEVHVKSTWIHVREKTMQRESYGRK